MTLDPQRIISYAQGLLRQHDADPSAHGLGAAWSNFTPTWTATGTAPSLATGTLNIRYTMIGKTVLWGIVWAPTSLTTYGTGTYEFTLPVKPRYATGATASPQALGTGAYYDASAGTTYNLQAFLARANATSFVLSLANGTNQYLGATVPVALADNDNFNLFGSYEAA